MRGLAIVGAGTIARRSHLPAIRDSAVFEPRAVIERTGSTLDGLPGFASVGAFLDTCRDRIEAVAFCTPAAHRFAEVMAVLRSGRHVLLEKPPVACLTELAPLVDAARAAGVSLFAAWHSRFGRAIAPARARLAGAAIGAVAVTWHEDVRTFHAGQQWIWTPPGFGVLDPGVNAFSILTEILPRPIFLRAAALHLPQNRAAPIAARIALADPDGLPVTVDLDFRHSGRRIWDVRIETADGPLLLCDGGDRLLEGEQVTGPAARPAFDGLAPHEYPALYRHFARLIDERRSDADGRPLMHALDVLALGDRHVVAPFHEDPAIETAAGAAR